MAPLHPNRKQEKDTGEGQIGTNCSLRENGGKDSMDNELRAKLAEARSLEETKEILNGHEGLDAERVYQEIQRRRSNQSEKIDLYELDAVSCGAARDWPTEGCAATCEESSWCWSNDACSAFDVVYDRFWWTDVHD